MPVIGVNTIRLTEQRDTISIGVTKLWHDRPFISSQDWDIANIALYLQTKKKKKKKVKVHYGKLTNV